MRSMKLAHGLPSALAKSTDYMVVSVKNTTALVPGTILCRAEVEEYCNGNKYDVTVVPYREEGK